MLAPPQISPLLAHVQRSVERERAAASARICQLRATLPALLGRIGDERDVAKVWLIGSLAWGDGHVGSDIDLVLDGLAPAKVDRLAFDLAGIAKAHVDVLRLEDLDPAFRTRVLRDGVRLL